MLHNATGMLFTCQLHAKDVMARLLHALVTHIYMTLACTLHATHVVMSIMWQLHAIAMHITWYWHSYTCVTCFYIVSGLFILCSYLLHTKGILVMS